jgi:tryptophan-rich sensory protein
MSLSRNQQVFGLIAWLVLSFITAAVGSAASIQAASFYAELVRPEWSPPGSVFGPVWTLLYTLMGISAWLVWRVNGFSRAAIALTLFLIQLALNALWSWLFFYWQLGGVAFAEIILLWFFIAFTLAAFWRIHKLAAALLVPYLLWVSFAALLNFSLWQLNPQLLG